MGYKRKYKKGEEIKNLNELSKIIKTGASHVWLFNKPYHIGWLISMQFRLVQTYVERHMMFYAVKTEEESNEN